MDLGTSLALAVGGAAVGWAFRGTLIKTEEPTCKCVCALNGQGSGEVASTGPSTFWILFIVFCGVLAILVSNVALAFRISFKDSAGEQEIRVGVKGKSKGVYGASLGLALTR